MSGDGILFDSVILIDHFNALAPATEFIRSVAETAHVSAITRAEVLTGFGRRDMAAAKSLLDRFILIPIDRAIADLAAELRRDHRWRLPDALQAATALHNRLILATRNTKDFPPRRYRFVTVPYRL